MLGKYIWYHIFSRKSNSTFTNVHLLVCQSVSKTPQQLEIIIFQYSSFQLVLSCNSDQLSMSCLVHYSYQLSDLHLRLLEIFPEIIYISYSCCCCIILHLLESISRSETNVYLCHHVRQMGCYCRFSLSVLLDFW